MSTSNLFHSVRMMRQAHRTAAKLKLATPQVLQQLDEKIRKIEYQLAAARRQNQQGLAGTGKSPEVVEMETSLASLREQFDAILNNAGMKLEGASWRALAEKAALLKTARRFRVLKNGTVQAIAGHVGVQPGSVYDGGATEDGSVRLSRTEPPGQNFSLPQGGLEKLLEQGVLEEVNVAQASSDRELPRAPAGEASDGTVPVDKRSRGLPTPDGTLSDDPIPRPTSGPYSRGPGGVYQAASKTAASPFRGGYVFIDDRSGAIDFDHAVHELVEMFIPNDQQAYNHLQACNRNLAAKKARGVYDGQLAVKLMQYCTDRSAKSYVQQFGDRLDQWNKIFPKAVRQKAASDLVHDFEQGFARGEFDSTLPKKYQKGAPVPGVGAMPGLGKDLTEASRKTATDISPGEGAVFAVGDRVKLTEDRLAWASFPPSAKNWVGMVDSVSDEDEETIGRYVHVQWDPESGANRSTDYYHEDALEKVDNAAPIAESDGPFV